MDTILHKLGTLLVGAYIAIAGFLSPAPQVIAPSENLGTTIPVVVAEFQSSLTASLSESATSMTLVNGLDKAGNALSGYICFNIDEGTSKGEFVCGTAVGASITGMIRGIDPVDGITERAALKKQHGRGASVKITNYPQLALLSRALNGTIAIPNALFYSTPPCTGASASTTICSKAYMDAVASQGAATSSNTVAGILKISVAAASANNPIAVGDNDNRVSPVSLATVTAGQVAALAGSSSTPSATNVYITKSDVATTSVVNAIVRASSTGLIDTGFIDYTSLVVGDGSDGSVVISATTTLTKDMNYQNLTVNAATSLITGGYRVYVNGILTNNGIISNNGTASGGTDGGAAGAAGTLLGGGVGAGSGVNGRGGGGGGGGVVFIAARTVAVQGTIQAKGGDGGNAVSGSNSSAGTAGTTIANSLIQSGTGGASGNATPNSGSSGGAITTSSKMSPKSPFMLMMMLDGSTRLAGGAGGAAGAANGATGNGGGGGGQGGVVVFIYGTLTTAGSISVAGGVGGTLFGTGTAGTNGSSGLAISIDL